MSRPVTVRCLEYPDRMAGRARETAAEVVMAVEAGRPPFDGTADRWLTALDGRRLASSRPNS